jgi:hypothetical protein
MLIEEEQWDYESDIEEDADDCAYSVASDSTDGDNDSDLDDFAPEDAFLCVYNGADVVDATRYSFRKRKHDDVGMGSLVGSALLEFLYVCGVVCKLVTSYYIITNSRLS